MGDPVGLLALFAGVIDLAAGRDDSVFDFEYGFADTTFDVHLAALFSQPPISRPN
jgi:hypothetical protein